MDAGVMMMRRTHSPDDENMAKQLLACSVSSLIITMIPVCLRFYVRLAMIRKFGFDDVILGITALALFGTSIGTQCATKYGLGFHYDTLSFEEKTTLLKMIFFSSLGYHATIMLLKAAFLFQYRRVFPLPTFQRLCDIGLAIIAAWAVAGIVGAVALCLPLPENWDPREPRWICDRRLAFWTAHGIAHVVSDFVILVMPLPLLRSLPLPRVQKIALIGVFSLGFSTCVISALRLTTLRASLQAPDLSWTSSRTVFWSTAEISCSIICLCIPTLRPLLAACTSDQREPRDDSNSDRVGFMSWRIRRQQQQQQTGALSEESASYIGSASVANSVTTTTMASATPLSQDVELGGLDDIHNNNHRRGCNEERNK